MYGRASLPTLQKADGHPAPCCPSSGQSTGAPQPQHAVTRRGRPRAQRQTRATTFRLPASLLTAMGAMPTATVHSLRPAGSFRKRTCSTDGPGSPKEPRRFHQVSRSLVGGFRGRGSERVLPLAALPPSLGKCCLADPPYTSPVTLHKNERGVMNPRVRKAISTSLSRSKAPQGPPSRPDFNSNSHCEVRLIYDTNCGKRVAPEEHPSHHRHDRDGADVNQSSSRPPP